MFFKIYGLGGLWIGWGYVQQDMIDVLLCICQLFNLFEFQMEVVCVVVLDLEFIQKCQIENVKWWEWLCNVLVQMGIGCDESYVNFVLVCFDSEDEVVVCDVVLKDDGIIVWWIGSYKLLNCLCIIVGDEVVCCWIVYVIVMFKGIC